MCYIGQNTNTKYYSAVCCSYCLCYYYYYWHQCLWQLHRYYHQNRNFLLDFFSTNGLTRRQTCRLMQSTDHHHQQQRQRQQDYSPHRVLHLIVHNLYTQDVLRAREKEGKSLYCVNLFLTSSSRLQYF